MERQYKDSGLMWIGKIPETWKVDRFKNKFKTGKGLNITKGDLVPEGIPVVSYGQVHSKQNTGTRLNDQLIRYIPSILAEEGVSSKVSVGDFIFADTSEDIDGCGNAVYVDKEIGLYAGYHSVIAFAKHPEESKYYAYLFLTECWRSQIRMRVTGIKVFSISQAILNETTIILPPLAEQQRIADFLDKKCGEIDGLMAIQEQMIAKLTDYKQSVITEAVSKGLNPDAQLVPSGIDWIGDVPKDWEITDMKNLCISITDGSHFSPERQSEGMPYITAGDVRGRGIDYENAMRIKIEDYNMLESQGCRPHKGDVLMVKDGATTGRVGMMIDDEKCVLLSSVAMLTPKEYVDSDYLMYLIQSDVIQAQIQLLMAGSAMPRVTLKKINTLKGLLIPTDDQQAIVEYLDTKCSEIDRLIETKRQKIETLKEYKKCVIYEAVTGKTDLRDS